VAKASAIEVQVGGRTVRISNPDRVYFPATGATKRDLVDYYRAVGPGIVNALRERPCMLHRFPTGVSGEKVHQKRVPGGAPPWLQTVRLHFPRYGQHADELCVTELAQVIWAVQMSTVEFHPWNSRRADVEKPDEWRIDLDPMPACPRSRVRRVAHVVHEVLDSLGAVGWPKTSGGKGLHVYVPLNAPHSYDDTKTFARAVAEQLTRLRPDTVVDVMTRSRRRGKVFVDWSQNDAGKSTIAPYSLRGLWYPTASVPVTWDEIGTTVRSGKIGGLVFVASDVAPRVGEVGDLFAPALTLTQTLPG
jgi:DNA ligase D-like protein (predicted polymerase)